MRIGRSKPTVEHAGARQPWRWVCLIALAIFVLTAHTDALGADALSVTVRPDHARVTPGGSVQLTATVRDESGREVDAELTWSLIPPRMGVVEHGLFVPSVESGRGIVRVVAEMSGKRGFGHAVVEVGSGEGQRLSVAVEPPRAVVDPLGRVRFSANVTDPATAGAIAAGLTWSVVPPDLGSIDADGLFTAGLEGGSGRVVARAQAGHREGLGDAGILVGPSSPAGVSVSVRPGSATLSPGAETTFAADVRDESGAGVDAQVEWSLVPARLGFIDEDGRFVAGSQEMAGRIVATVVTSDGPVRDFASVEIRRPGPGNVRVIISPREVALAPGGDVQFQVSVSGPDGEPVDVPIEWSLQPEWLGTLTNDGLLIIYDELPEPAVNGRWSGTVVASLETAKGIDSDAASVTVRADGPPRRLRIRPQRATLAPGDDLQFELLMVGAGDLDDWTTEWAVFPENLGTITPDGLLTASTELGDPASDQFGPRDGVVAARATFVDGTSLTDRAHIRVRLPGQPVRVTVRPALAIVPPNGTQQFEAVVLGADGQIYDLPVAWRLTPGHLGTISSDGLFTAADLTIDPGGWQRPRGQVVAELTVGAGRVFRGVAAVIIDLSNPQAFVTVSPKTATLGPGEALQLAATVTDDQGEVLALPVEWTVRDQSVGVVTADGLFTAVSQVPSGTTRRTQVIAWVTYEGRVYWDFATIRVARR